MRNLTQYKACVDGMGYLIINAHDDTSLAFSPINDQNQKGIYQLNYVR